MIYVALGMLGFGISDLVRWSPDGVGVRRAVVAAAFGAGAVSLVAALSGFEIVGVVAAAVIALAVLLVWSAFDLLPAWLVKPRFAFTLVFGALVVLIAASGSAGPIGGDVAAWYSNLAFGFTARVPVDQFVLGVGAALFLLATGNRIVRLTLAATEASLLAGEGTLRGGRLLGPMERVIVAAGVVSGGVAAAAFVIAAKGLLRFREIRSVGEDGGGAEQARIDEVTEYFLVGTFASVLLAAAVGVLVLAAG